jgi:hypothetical protein
MINNIIFIIYLSLFTYNYKEFSLDSIYEESLRKIEYINQQKKNNDPKFDAKINIVIHKQLTISKKIELLNSGLVNENNVNKYLIDTYILRWRSLMGLKEFKVKIMNNLLVNIKKKNIYIHIYKK